MLHQREDQQFQREDVRNELESNEGQLQVSGVTFLNNTPPNIVLTPNVIVMPSHEIDVCEKDKKAKAHKVE